MPPTIEVAVDIRVDEVLFNVRIFFLFPLAPSVGLAPRCPFGPLVGIGVVGISTNAILVIEGIEFIIAFEIGYHKCLSRWISFNRSKIKTKL